MLDSSRCSLRVSDVNVHVLAPKNFVLTIRFPIILSYSTLMYLTRMRALWLIVDSDDQKIVECPQKPYEDTGLILEPISKASRILDQFIPMQYHAIFTTIT